MIRRTRSPKKILQALADGQQVFVDTNHKDGWYSPDGSCEKDTTFFPASVAAKLQEQGQIKVVEVVVPGLFRVGKVD